jgi:precorrin-2/cobalt-factor-2 C20-methyltransferase
MNQALGTFYGVGVGPGDPGLITVKGLEILRGVEVIFAARTKEEEQSLAFDIVRGHLEDPRVVYLHFPMTRDRDALQRAWEESAEEVLKALGEGHDAAFVTLGDPLTYSTYGYLLNTLKSKAPDVRIVTIPGVTSFNAAAALANIPLAEGEESLFVVSGALGGERLRKVIEATENVVLLKTYRKFDHIYQTLEELDLLDRATCISSCGMEGETVVQDLRELKGKKMPYLSLVIVKKKGKGDGEPAR